MRPAAGPAVLDLELSPGDLPGLLRAPALLSRRQGRVKATRTTIVWHDTPDGALASDGLSLSQGASTLSRTHWRLESLRPDGHRPNGRTDWLPGGPAPLLAEANSADALGHAIPNGLTPVAVFAGTLRVFTLDCDHGEARLGVLEGVLRGVVQDRPACRLILQGQASDIAALARALSEVCHLRVPRAGLAAQAIALAAGRLPAPRHTGAPAVPPGVSVADALGLAIAHLADVILHWASLVPGSETPEPVHQMRVGIRRLRSALSVFRRRAQADHAPEPWLDDLAAQLKLSATALGGARDWDVFLAETGAEIAQAFPQDRRIARLLAGASRRRAAAYADLAAFLQGSQWARLELTLALLPTTRPWHDGATPEQADRLAAPVQAFATRALDRRLKQVISPGATVKHLTPEALHDLRKQAKRLRYAIEFFAPLFPGKSVRKYSRHLEHLQEVLGAVNDTAVAAALMAQLGGSGERAFAAGVVQGFGAAHRIRASHRVERAWGKFYHAEPFWD